MRICRYDRDRLGVVYDDAIFDITALFDRNPPWPLPPGDWIIRQWTDIAARIPEHVKRIDPVPLSSVRLENPVAGPSKIIGAPVNYRAHIDEANADSEINRGKTFGSLDQYGLFLKANSSLIGVADEIVLSFPDRRNDHEVELAVIIGKRARNIDEGHALDYVLGYSIGLDMTTRGSEFPCFRKSNDTYSVLGPWIVTKDEIKDPNNLDLSLSINGKVRQFSNTKHMIFNVQRLIAYASKFYTLHEGDILMTGTPEGVSQVHPGDVIDAFVEGIGNCQITVSADETGIGGGEAHQPSTSTASSVKSLHG